MASFSIYTSKCIKRAPARFRRFRNFSASDASACCAVRSGGDSARAGAHQRATTGPGDAFVPSAALAESRGRRCAGARAAGGRPRLFFSHRFALILLTRAAPHGGARCERARESERAEFGPRGALDPAAALANSRALRCAEGVADSEPTFAQQPHFDRVAPTAQRLSRSRAARARARRNTRNSHAMRTGTRVARPASGACSRAQTRPRRWREHPDAAVPNTPN